MVLKVIGENAEAVSEVNVNDSLFKTEVNKNAIYEAIKNALANARQGTHSTKTRAEASGGKSKPWRQKGTGRARSGTRRSPLWVGGGKTFTPKPRDYSYTLPRKVKRLALLSAFSLKYADSKVKVIDDLKIETPSTKKIAGLLDKIKEDGSRKVAVVVGKSDELEDNYKNLILSMRNIKDLKVINADALSIHKIFYADELIFTKTAIEKVNNLFAAKEASKKEG